VSCPRCSTEYPAAARFCSRCGADVRSSHADGHRRRGVYAAHSGQPVVSVDVVTSLMPLASASAPQTYKFALAVGLALPVIAALFGFLPLALAGAAVVVPIVYVLYLYDVNEWEDQPVPVVGAAIALAGVLAVGWTMLWRDGMLGGPIAFVGRQHSSFIDAKTLLVGAVLAPIVGEVLRQVGPLWLSTRARFDDLLDAVTFGVASGAAYAAIETIVLNHDVIFGGAARYEHADAALWVSLVVTAGLVKPVIYGAATGIALAAFSGLGEGYDGFKPSYVRGLLEALGVEVAFAVGLYLTGQAGGTTGVVLGLLWGLLLAGLVILRLRFVLHDALLEGALEAASRGATPGNASRDIGFCSECELPLLHEASFCVACGTSVRAASKLTRRANATPQEVLA
jgi:hypothetical protein